MNQNKDKKSVFITQTGVSKRQKMQGLQNKTGYSLWLIVVLLLLYSGSTLYAQEDRHVRLAGEQFTIGELIRGIEEQADITILNVSPNVNRGEVVRYTASPEFVRDVIDQVLAGTAHVFRSAATYTVIVVERTDAAGRRVFEQVFVDTATGRITGIDEIFGDAALGTRAGTIEEMLVTQVLSGRAYTYHSSGTYTIITVTVNLNGRMTEQHIVVDMETGQVVPIERLLTPQLRAIPTGTDLFEVFRFPTDYFPRFSIKTNLLYGATTTPNLGMEFFLNRYFTLDLSFGWNPFVHRDNVKFAHLMVQPTLRFWIQEPFNGHFLGLSGMYCYFNISGIRLPYNLVGRHLKPTQTGVGTEGTFRLFSRLALGGPPTPDRPTYRFYGHAYGASLQYGHQWVLSPRWSIEASINVGWLRLHYDVWTGGWCGTRLGPAVRDYWGPTNASISLIYIIR